MDLRPNRAVKIMLILTPVYVWHVRGCWSTVLDILFTS